MLMKKVSSGSDILLHKDGTATSRRHIFESNRVSDVTFSFSVLALHNSIVTRTHARASSQSFLTVLIEGVLSRLQTADSCFCSSR